MQEFARAADGANSPAHTSGAKGHTGGARTGVFLTAS